MKANLIGGTAVLLSLLIPLASSQAADCNGNGVEDSQDVAPNGFAVSSLGAAAGPGSVTGLQLVDLNLDQRTDIIVATQYTDAAGEHYAATLFYHEDDAFLSPGTGAFSLPFAATAIGAVDTDQNQFLDLGFSDGSTQAVAFNQGDNSFRVVGGQPLTGVPAAPPLASSGADQQAGDVNADGRQDLVVKTGPTAADIRLRAQNGDLETVYTITFQFSDSCSSLSPSLDVAVAPLEDLDGDGDMDPVVIGLFGCSTPNGLGLASQVAVLENKGQAGFVQTTLRVSGQYLFSRYFDVNADGVEDLLFAYQGSSLSAMPPSHSSPGQNGAAVIAVELVSTSQDVNGNAIPDECERAVPGDFGGDRITDVTVARDWGGLWLWLTDLSEGSKYHPLQQGFGLSQFDLPYAGDFDGDGKFEPGVVRDAWPAIPSLFGLWWYNMRHDGSAEAIQFGLQGDTPITGYFDADNKTDRAVLRSISGQLYWFIRAADGSANVVPWGLTGDTAYAADMNGDHIDELIVARNFLGGVYWFIRSVDGSFSQTIQWGLAGDITMPPADVDGDGTPDLAVARAAGRFLNFYVRRTDGTPQVVNFGLLGDLPHLGYYAGEAGAEVSVSRRAAPPTPANWRQEAFHYQRTAAGLNRVESWGLGGDMFIRPDGLGIRR